MSLPAKRPGVKVDLLLFALWFQHRMLIPAAMWRRWLLALAGAQESNCRASCSAAAASGAALLAPLERLFADVGADVPPARRRLLQVNAYAADAETPLDALTTYLTPNDLFFVRHHWVPQLPDKASWKLTVDGDVSRPLELTLADLKKLPKASAVSVLQCAGNGRGLYKPYIAGVQWKYGAVGNAHWTGVRVKDLLAKAGLKGGAKHVRRGARKVVISAPAKDPDVTFVVGINEEVYDRE